MIQFNLLPNVKLEYIKARRSKRFVMTVSTIVGAASLAVLILLFLTIAVFQKKHLSDLSKDIKQSSAKLSQTPDLTKVLTIQNQLNQLTSLHDQKPVASRAFGYITQVTPTQVSISKIDFDFTSGKDTIGISGAADSISTINKFVDTLKFTMYQVINSDGQKSDEKNAFSGVVLASFSEGSQDKTKQSNYQINLTFDPAIFDNSKTISLDVPKDKITTRSDTEKPNENLFQLDSSTGGTQ